MEHNIFGTIFYEGTGSKLLAINDAISKGNMFLVSYQKSLTNYWYGSYKSKTTFINNFNDIPENERKFYEVLTGFTSTYADLEWTDMNIPESCVIDNFVRVFGLAMSAIDSDFNHEDAIYYWSISSGIAKKSLHFNFIDTKCWENTREQNLFWRHFKKCLYNLKNECPEFFYLEDRDGVITEKCIIDFAVYTKDRQWRTLFSHKEGSDRILKPCSHYGQIEYDTLKEFNKYSDFSNYLTNYHTEREPIFYELPEHLRKKADIQPINIAHTDLERLIADAVPNTLYKNTQGNLIILQNNGDRKCIIGGELNESDNCFLVIRKDGIYFGCHDEHCKGKFKKIQDRELCILDESIKYFQNWRQVKAIKDISYEEIAEFVKRTIVFISNSGNGFYVTKNYKNKDEHYEILKNLNNDAFKIVFTSFEIHQETKEKIPITIKLTDVINNMRDEITYDYLDFVPYSPLQIKNNPDYLEEHKYNFNIFSGFKAKHMWVLNNDHIKKIEPILSHIKNIICKGDILSYEYLINWLAHLIQFPDIKIGVMIVLKSTKQGAGKNIIFDFINKWVFGEKYCLEINNIEMLTGKFNSLLQHKLLTLADEVGMFGNDHRNSDKLKNIITQPRQNIEKKGMDAYTINDFNNFIALTNNDWAFKIECGDRRHACYEISNEKIDDEKYFNNIGECFNKEAGDIFYTYMLNRDISSWQKLNIPMTKMKRDLKLNSTPRVILYMIDLIEKIENIFLDSNDRIHTEDLFTKFKEWLSARGYNDKYNIRMFKADLEKINITQEKPFKIACIKKVGYKLDFEKMKVNIREFLKDPEFEFLEESDNTN